jgi:hypothetical protein
LKVELILGTIFSCLAMIGIPVSIFRNYQCIGGNYG